MSAEKIEEMSVLGDVLPAANAFVDEGFEDRLIEHTRPIAEHYLAMCLHHLFSSGLFVLLEKKDKPILIEDLATQLELNTERLTGLFLYLANEEVVNVTNKHVSLTKKGRQYGEFKAWYTIMIGGYATTISQIGESLKKDGPYCTREGRYVGLGSCEMSRFDGLPVTKTLMERSQLKCSEILDLGCGNALYLVDFCNELPELKKAHGVEPDKGGFLEAQSLVKDAEMHDKISLYNQSSTEFLNSPPEDCNPDLIVFGFVLHEVLAQEGREAVVGLLSSVVKRFPAINIIVIEVIDEIDNPAYMNHGVAKNFWNPYYLLHYFTLQKLEKQDFWQTLFLDAGLECVDLITTDKNVDSSGLELGFMLKKSS